MLVKKQLKKSRSTPVLPPNVGPDAGTTNGSISHEIIRYIITAGCQAPSGDNCQPWNFEYCTPCLKVFLDPLADNCFFNLNQMASQIACGAAIENILVAGSRFGISGKIDYLPDEHQPNLMAKIHLSCTNQEEDPLQRFIWERHTNRTQFNGRPLAQTDMDLLRKSLAAFPDTDLVLVTKKEKIDQAAQLVQGVDCIRSERKDLHEHLMKMICFTDNEAVLRKDGFPLKNLEAGVGGEMFLKLCRPWSVMRVLNRLGMGKIIAAVAARGIQQASAVGLLKIKGNTMKDIMVGGQALERLWLSCAHLGISFQPMTAATLFRYRWELDRKTDFSLAHQQLLGKLWPVYDAVFDVAKGETHIMLFRLGYGKPVSCRTLRKYNVQQPDIINR